ncbi:mechanosensitive ion channel domain-containing protein [Falsiruegeria mediterranea]|uniref:Small-conductance mechanosensitive channel n=1 Tax=Falsiruegeria mediterranea M17 TaxID=1200281 RepID=A0A2R8CAZ7_9RHOB|nr:mechanosensitive ion channel domain-containing protein [Falsiruegeria mediterranea]SPJ29553.1 Mechanosensitive channel MscK [Falsiruegeria mediterranea M17]
MTSIIGVVRTGLRTLLLMCSLALLTLPTLAQTEDPAVSLPIDQDAQDDTFQAPVIVDGHELFVLRGSSALPAIERVTHVQDRIIEIAAGSKSKTVEITYEDTDLGIKILADGTEISLVTQADAELDQMDISVLAALQGDAIRDAVLAYRSERTDEARVTGAIEAGMWTIGFAVFSVLIIWLRRRFKLGINAIVRRNFAEVETATNAQVQADAIAALIRFGVNFILLVLFFLGAYYYLSFILLAFAETRYVAQILLTYVTEPVLNIILGFVAYLPNLITLLIIGLLTQYVIKGMRVFFDAVEAETFRLRDFEKHWINPTFNIARTIIILIALVFSFPYIPGSDSAAFQGLTILIGAMLSLGSNSVVGNVLAGLFVIYRRSTSMGDRIQVGEHIGDVVQIKLMETHIKSIKNELISIPNAQLMNSEVINYSKKIDGSGLLLHTTVGIGYEEPPEKVEAMLIEAAHRTKDLKARPVPFVLWTALADYAINYQINAYTTRGASIPRIKSDLHRNIMAVFTENDVQIMTPSYIADPPEAKIPPKAWDGQLAHMDDT